MFLSNETVQVLKNLASINTSLLIKPGKTLKSMSTMKNILVTAEITEQFDRTVAIYDLNQFLNSLSLIAGADLYFGDNSVNISDGKNSIQYRYSDPAVIVSPPDKELKLPSQDVCLVLTEETIEKVKKAAAVLQIADVSIIGDGEKISVAVRDKKNSGSNSYSIDVGETTDVFQFNLKVENLKLLAGDYDVIISAKNLAHFVNHARPVSYYIAMEPDSTFNV